jgi:hypothetical protein
MNSNPLLTVNGYSLDEVRIAANGWVDKPFRNRADAEQYREELNETLVLSLVEGIVRLNTRLALSADKVRDHQLLQDRMNAMELELAELRNAKQPLKFVDLRQLTNGGDR